MQIRSIVLSQLQSVTEEFTPLPFPENVHDDILLDTFRLDSIALTSLFVRLEEQLGFIPTMILDNNSIPQTVGELVHAYEVEAHACEGGASVA